MEQSRRMAYRDWGESVTSGKFKIKSVSDITIRDLKTGDVIMKWDGVSTASVDEPKHDVENKEVRIVVKA